MPLNVLENRDEFNICLSYLDRNLIQYEIDFTSVEYISKSDASAFTFGTRPYVFNVVKKGADANSLTTGVDPISIV